MRCLRPPFDDDVVVVFVGEIGIQVPTDDVVDMDPTDNDDDEDDTDDTDPTDAVRVIRQWLCCRSR